MFAAVLVGDVRASTDIGDEPNPQWINGIHNGLTPVMQAASLGDAQMLQALLRALLGSARSYTFNAVSRAWGVVFAATSKNWQ